MTQAAASPWWLDGGEEQCPHCLQSYAFELEVRCIYCDAPSCPHCAVTVRETAAVHCPACPPSPAREES